MNQAKQPLPFEMAEYQDRLLRVRSKMAEEEIDVLLLVNPQNIYYLTGCRTYGGGLAPDFLVVPLEGAPVHVTRAFESNTIKAFSWVEDIITFIDTQDPFLPLVDLLQGAKLTGARIGLELGSSFFPALTFERLKGGLPRARFIDASNLVGELRLIKSPAEIQYVREAANLADIGMAAAIEAVRVGAYEYEIVAAAMYALYSHGQDDICSPVLVISGVNSGLAHCSHHGRRIGKGEPVLIELAGCSHLYCANILRTVFVGEPTSRMRAIYKAAKMAHDRAIQAIRPGVGAGDIDRIAHQVIEDAGFGPYFIRRSGYALGITFPPNGWHEPLNLLEGDSHVLAPGMVLSVEPGPSLFGEGGASLGDDVLVTETGYEFLTTPTQEDIVIK